MAFDRGFWANAKPGAKSRDIYVQDRHLDTRGIFTRARAAVRRPPAVGRFLAETAAIVREADARSLLSQRSRNFRGSSDAGRLVRPGPDPMQAHTMRPQPGFSGRHVFGQASHGLPERERMIHVLEVRDLVRRDSIP